MVISTAMTGSRRGKGPPVAMVVAPTTEHMMAAMQKANPNPACKTLHTFSRPDTKSSKSPAAESGAMRHKFSALKSPSYA